MSEVFFPGNAKLIGVAEQLDKDTPAASPTHYFQVTGYTRDDVRVLAPLQETDRHAQTGRNHVTAITPGCSLDVYGRYDEAALIAEAVLWEAVEDVTNGITTITPSLVPVYYTVWEIEPDLYTDRYDGCVFGAATFTGKDEGETELRVTGLKFMALGFTAHVTEPVSLPAPNDETPAIHAEATLTYGGVHPGTTSEFTLVIERAVKRLTGDNGFRSLAFVPQKLDVSGTVSLYMQDDARKRSVDTGSAAGTAPTVDIFEETLDIVFDRAADSTSISFALGAVSYLKSERGVNLDGAPLVEVTPFMSQPGATLADNITITVEA